MLRLTKDLFKTEISRNLASDSFSQYSSFVKELVIASFDVWETGNFVSLKNEIGCLLETQDKSSSTQASNVCFILPLSVSVSPSRLDKVEVLKYVIARW